MGTHVGLRPPQVSRRGLLRGAAALVATGGLHLRITGALAHEAGAGRWGHVVGVVRRGEDLVSLEAVDEGATLARWRSRDGGLELVDERPVGLPDEVIPAAVVRGPSGPLVLAQHVTVQRSRVDSGYADVRPEDRALLPPEDGPGDVELTVEQVHAVRFDPVSGRTARLRPGDGFSVVLAAGGRSGAALIGGADVNDGRAIDRLVIADSVGGGSRSDRVVDGVGGEIWAAAIGGEAGEVLAASTSGGATVLRHHGRTRRVPVDGYVTGVSVRGRRTVVDVQSLEEDRVQRLVHDDGAWAEDPLTRDRQVIATWPVSGDPSVTVVVERDGRATVVAGQS